jgi:hypothetical protein
LLEFWAFKQVTTQEPAKDASSTQEEGTTGSIPFLVLPIQFQHIAIDFSSKQRGQQESSLKIEFCLSYRCSKLLNRANEDVQLRHQKAKTGSSPICAQFEPYKSNFASALLPTAPTNARDKKQHCGLNFDQVMAVQVLTKQEFLFSAEDGIQQQKRSQEGGSNGNRLI